MKTVYDFISLNGKQFDETEYKCLRDEQNKRLDLAFNHGLTVTSIILVFFAAIFVFVGDFYTIATDTEKSIIGQNIFTDIIILVVIAFFCGLPTIIIKPFSVKFHDNIRVITNIGAYCRVFYEYPSLIFNKNKSDINDNNSNNNDCTPQKKNKAYGWELLHGNSVVPQANSFATEYFIIALISIILSVTFSCVLYACIFTFHSDYFNSPLGYVVLIFSMLVVAAYWICLILATHLIYKNQHAGKFFKAYSELYFMYYVDTAVEMELLTEEQAKELIDYFNYKRGKDCELTNRINKLL